MWVYLQNQATGLWDVGYYVANQWFTVQSFSVVSAARREVHYLNGGDFHV